MSINAIGSNIPGEVQFGLTGNNTFPVGSVLQGNGTNPITTISATANGQTLIGATSAAAVFNTITAGENITVDNGANSITIGFTGSGGGVLIPWTPTIFSTSSVWTSQPTYALQNGFYLTFGKLNIISFELTLTSKGTVNRTNPPVQIYIFGFPNYQAAPLVGSQVYAAVLENNSIGAPTFPFAMGGSYAPVTGSPDFYVLRSNTVIEDYNVISNTTTWRVISMYIAA